MLIKRNISGFGCGVLMLSALNLAGCDAETAIDAKEPVDLSFDSGTPEPAIGEPDAGEEATKGHADAGTEAPLSDAGDAGKLGDAGDAGPLDEPAPEPRKYRGAIVVNSDYTSISVSVVNTAAKVLAEVFLSGASADAKLNEPLAGDIVLPSSDMFGDEVVLIDRSKSVLTWADVKTAKVRAQLDVGPGFDANPHDYVQVAKDKAYVSRFRDNGNAGSEPFDEGLDLLVIDPSVPELIGSVDLRSVMDKEEEFPATPDRMAYAGGRVHVMISGLLPDFSDIAEARIVSVDVATDEIVQVLKLDGMRNCTELTLSPDTKTLAVGCTGFFRQDPKDGWPDAGVVLVEVGEKLAETARFESDSFQHCVDDTCQNTQINGVSFATDELLMVTTLGDNDVSYPAMVVELNTDTEETRTVFDEGGAFDIAGPACYPTGCLVPNATFDEIGLLRFPIKDGKFGAAKLTAVDETTGLPPRHVQRF